MRGIVGEVLIKRWASVWYNSVVRGDVNRVEYRKTPRSLYILLYRIMNFSSIGDNTVIHTAASLPTGMSAKVYIGHNVTIGAHCTLYSCHINDDVVVGDKCVILEGARLEKSCMLAPGTVVPPGRLIPAKQLWAGNPAEYVKDLDVGETWANYTLSYIHVALGDMQRNEFMMWPSNYLQKPTTQEDIDLKDDEMDSMYTTKNLYRGIVKYYA